MRSSSGAHFLALDHVRALAVFMVFTWHFVHTAVPFGYTPSVFVFSLFEEGFTGVALFMTLSGYLFAKLLDGHRIRYGAFLWNRALRLLPLLAVVVAINCLMMVRAGADLGVYLRVILLGAILPTLPNGGWSITVEFQFYLLLPALLWLCRRDVRWLLLLVVAAVSVRALLYLQRGEIQSLAYWTLVGRIDQFLWGIFAFHARHHVARRHGLAWAGMLSFALFLQWFAGAGGFYGPPPHPPGAIWILLPTLEGAAFALAIAYYDASFSPSATTLSRAVGRVGEYSYSIYLLHFFFVTMVARQIHFRVADLSGFYPALLWSLICFVPMALLSGLSYRFVESPFLRLRRPYLRT